MEQYVRQNDAWDGFICFLPDASNKEHLTIFLKRKSSDHMVMLEFICTKVSIFLLKKSLNNTPSTIDCPFLPDNL